MSTTELLPPTQGTSMRSLHSQSRAPRTAAAKQVRDPAWQRPALIALLALTALAYLWDLSASGYANSFYAAAVQAGTKSWKAMFFGSLDASNFITVDKPPASLWVMDVSGRIFGFSSWSLLAPQALEGVAAVGLLYATVKRWFGAGAGLAAGAVFALTPVAALMFRFDNPDALLVMMLVAGAYYLTRALEQASTRWLLAAGTMIGIAFLAKMMQAFIVLPGFALVYIVAAPTTLKRRIGQLLAAGLALVVSAGWWVAIVALWPAGSRPYIDGSPSNSILDLITGYNGLGRLVGASGPGGGGGGGGGTGFSGATGPLRLFNELMGGQASWLLPAALLALAIGLWSRRGEPRTDHVRTALLLWGSWLIVTSAVFSFGQGVIHTYYTVALAPAIGALVAIGGKLLFDRRETQAARLLAALALGGSAAWAYVLLARTPSWEPWLRHAIVVGATIGVVGLLAAPALGRITRRATIVAAMIGVLAALAGPIAFAADTITTPHTGSVVSAGPASAGGMGMGGADIGGGGYRSGGPPTGGHAGARSGGTPPSSPGASPSAAGSGASLFGNAPGGSSSASSSSNVGRSSVGGSPGAGMGTQVNSALKKALEQNASAYSWVAATSGSQSAASLELATGEPVMGIGGFNNEGGNVGLAEFAHYVKQGKIHYYVASGGSGGGPGAGGNSSSAIAIWVKANFKAKTIGGETVYDLTEAS
jgi:4-amino-4-deoxy-L-arabinose transferase-like glycosyltransferase